MSTRAELRNQQQELYQFNLRLGVASAFVLLLIGILGFRFFYLQGVRYQHYHTLAENNRISIAPVVPNRGIITDRNGVVLAHNYSAYTLEIVPSRVVDLEKTLRVLGQIVALSPRDIKRFKKALAEASDFESVPLRSRLNDIEVARFAANRFRFPGVTLNARLFRHYPDGALMSHIVGHIGRINEADKKRILASEDASNYRGSEHIGKLGIEQSYERELHGITGFEEVETDANGHAVRVLGRHAPISGNNLRLTVDARLQQIASQAFGNFRGALVAIEPKTGEVLAFVSQPGFDPNLFVDGIDTQNWNALNNSPDRPLNNRALRGVYPPGSTFKPFMALAGLESGKRTPNYTISDPGFFSLPGSSHRYRDWKVGGHGAVNLHKSVVISCDTYYYGLANDLGIERIHEFMTHFGFGQKSGIDIDGELGGNLPSPAWKLKRFKQPWWPGETVIVGIGQGYMLTTPLQLAFATATLANNGVALKPHLVKTIEDRKTGALRYVKPQITHRIELKPEHLELVKAAMVDVTRPGGTAARAGAGAEYTIAGKTGTAQVIGIKQNQRYVESRVAERHRDHALFVAFAPAEDPKIALGILVENGGHGGSVAAPIARQVMDFYLLGKKPAAPVVAGEDEGAD